MAFRRTEEPLASPPPAVLTARMIGIGLVFAGEAEPEADIEETLVFASVAGMTGDALRTLSVLTTWLGVHHAYVNVDRLVRLVRRHPSERVRGYWAAVAHWLRKDRRFERLARVYQGHPIELLPVGTAFQIARRGEDPRFTGTKLLVPQGTLRDRAADVLSPEVLVRRHAGYRSRVRTGPTFRADVWAILEKEPGLAVAEVARRAACSFATAWQAAKDFKVLHAAGG